MCIRDRTSPILIDGELSEAHWKHTPRMGFAGLVDGAPAWFDSYSQMVWDDENLYVGFWVEEPVVAATLTERDDPIYKNNDVEVFIAGQDTYYEFEINAFGTIYEVFFI